PAIRRRPNPLAREPTTGSRSRSRARARCAGGALSIAKIVAKKFSSKGIRSVQGGCHSSALTQRCVEAHNQNRHQCRLFKRQPISPVGAELFSLATRAT